MSPRAEASPRAAVDQQGIDRAVRLARYQRVARSAGLLTLGTGALVLAGWWLKVSALKSVLPGLATMKPNTALAFVFLGLALRMKVPPRRGSGYGLAAALVPALLGLLTLTEYASHRDFGIDQALFADAENAQGLPDPGRMAPITALNMLILGTALSLVGSGSRPREMTAQILALLATLIGMVSLAGYAYGVRQLYSVPAFSSIALHTALLFAVTGCGVLCARPSVGLMAVISHDHQGGLVARRILPVAFLLPLFLAWLRLKGQQAGWYRQEFELAIFATTNGLVFATVVWWTARSLNRADAERLEVMAALRASEGRYRTLFEQAPDGIVIADPESRYLDANPSICRMLGYERGELIGRHASDIVAPMEVEHIEPALAAIRNEAEHRREWRFRRKDGSDFPADVIATSMPDGALLGVIRDITERKAAEAALLGAHHRLEERVAERTRELEAANRQLEAFSTAVANDLRVAEAADKIKSAFLATMSHELRTPLNSILGFTGIVLQGMAGPLNPEQAKQLGMVQGSARHLLALINDVLDLSKIEAGRLDLRLGPFDLPAAIQQVTASIRPLAERKGLALSTLVSPALSEMVSDRRRVEQILLNLLSNAVKFTAEGEVTLTAEAVSGVPLSPGGPGEDAVRIRVSDTGIGIKACDLPTLFQPFRQLDSGLARQNDGTGLGLAISGRLASLLGGGIEARSEWSKGSTFTLTLPLSRTRP